MIIYYATTNKGKVNSLQRDLESIDFTIEQVDMEIPEPRSSDVKEIAHDKVLYAFERIQKPVVALDAGFYIESLNGFPKAFVNFALETIGNEGLLKLVEEKDRNLPYLEAQI